MVKLIKFDEENASESELEVYLSVVRVANQYGVDPSSSVESEEFFQHLLEEFTGSLENLTEWLEEQLPRYFTVINERPRWKQSASWPFSHGKPMMFAGQIDLSIQPEGPVSDIYHDDTSLYIFIGKGVSPIVITQQM